MNMKDMDEMTQFLQIQLHRNFGYDDDIVIKLLEQSMADLRKYKMDLPPPPQQCELPKYEFGRFIEPEFDTKVGRRKTKFSEIERKTTETVIMRWMNELIRIIFIGPLMIDYVSIGEMKQYKMTLSRIIRMTTMGMRT